MGQLIKLVADVGPVIRQCNGYMPASFLSQLGCKLDKAKGGERYHLHSKRYFLTE
jgi:hypothetical protein